MKLKSQLHSMLTWKCNTGLSVPRRMAMRGACRGCNGKEGEQGIRPITSNQLVMGYDMEVTSHYDEYHITTAV
jgi:hypothetical protein